MKTIQQNSLFENALAVFITDSLAATSKAQKLKQNMEYRRKLEQLKEEKRLQREMREFDFELARK